MKGIGKAGIFYNILSVIMVAFGTGLVIRPGLSALVVCRMAGTILLFYGAVKLAGYFAEDIYQLAFQFDFAMGILSAALGMILIVRAEHMVTVFPVFMGVVILVDAVFKIQTSMDARKFGLKKWWLILILAVLAGAAGTALIIYPLNMAKIFMILLGLNFILDGLLNLWVVLYTVRIRKK